MLPGSLTSSVVRGVTKGARLRYLLILDFEATCGEEFNRDQTEIIEFPTLLYNIENDEVQATFHEYVRPVIHPILTRFCTELTGIQQSTVDAADTFPAVWGHYQEFLKSNTTLDHLEASAFLTCGDWDLKSMLPLQLTQSALQQSLDPLGNVTASPFDRWINVKKSFRDQYGLRHMKGMQGMLKRSNLELEGRHHSGIDDCKNIVRIVRKMRADGWRPWEGLSW